MPKQTRYDLEERTEIFARKVREISNKAPQTLANQEDFKQLIRSSGSVGANYIEANESLSKKDFIYRIKICRKEAKESRYWLNLVNVYPELTEDINYLFQEATELMKIFSSIMRNSMK